MTDSRFINYANRGMSLEDDINVTNRYYLDKDTAVIYKKPTPIKITKTDYTRGKISEAFFETQSTLDYNGIWKGRYIEFDAKETHSKTIFPLANIHLHQLEHIKRIIRHGGICFLIIRCTVTNSTYLFLGEELLKFIKENTRKSIPISYLESHSYKIELKYSPRLDYLKIINAIFTEEI